VSGVDHLGELAALATAGCWTITAMVFETAGRRVGSLTVNLVRLAFATVLLGAWGAVTRGMPLPLDATPEAWGWLAASGVVGLTFGDLCLFRALVLIGARLSLLVMSLVPPMTAILGWLALGEGLGTTDLIGMALTVGGVVYVVIERRPAGSGDGGLSRRDRRLGVLLCLGGAFGQAAGLVLSKVGMKSYDAFSATQIRVIAGMAGFALIFCVIGWWPRVAAAMKDGRAVAIIGAGSVFGPFLGISLSLIAVQNTEAGVAATIMAIVPVLIIVPSVLIKKERISARAIIGAVVAVAGVGVMFL
jgi:drug/metabolite transporter (DMT)-like permease